MCPTITVGSFFRRVRSTFLFICSTTSNLNNSNLRSASKTKRKKNRRPQPRNHTKDPPPPLFSELCDFLKLGLKFFPQRVPLQFFLMFCNTMDVKKLQRVPSFTFFGTVTLFKNLIKKFFWEIFSCLQRVPLQFFKIFCNQLEFHKARRVPRLNFEP